MGGMGRAGLRPVLVAVLLGAGVAFPTWAKGPYPERVKIRVRVVDDANQPVTNALVRMYYEDSTRSENHEGYVNGEGYYESDGPSVSQLTVQARKEGYYRGTAEFTVARVAAEGVGAKAPDLTVVLRPIRDPRPMFARRVETTVPRDDVPVGFDLKQGRWVFPYQDGQHADLLLMVSRRVVDPRNFSALLDLGFSAPGDGVAEVEPEGRTAWGRSDYDWPYEAPETGYASNRVWRIEYNAGEGVATGIGASGELLALRVRSEMDVEGKITSALYGRIGHVEFGGISATQMWVRFTYWLNPEGTRNIEFDRRANLFQNLSDDEVVNEF